MNHPLRRLCRPAGPLGGAALLVFLTAGCDNRKPLTSPANTTAAVAVDAEAQAVASLEDPAKQTADQCRTVLQQLDSLDSTAARPVLSEAERADLAAFLRLTEAEAREAAQPTFSQTDAAYLEECLLVRAGVRALKLDRLSPLDQARLTFDWVCRLVYVDDRINWPSNPWTTLQAGSGLALSRAYAVLAAWQQLGLDGCLVGPPALKDTASTAGPPGSGQPDPKYAPVRACGVKIDKEVYLFEPAAGRAVPAADGKGVMTLAQARAKPDAVKDLGPADEAGTWQPFLAPALSAVGRRMDWLQKFNPGGLGARLFQDVGGQRARFAADLPSVQCGGWNPPGDAFSATRVLARYAAEEQTGKQAVALRDHHRVKMAPLEQLPRTSLKGNALAHLSMMFARPFEGLRYTPDAPRTQLLRGQYQEAIATLSRVKENVDDARTRVEQDPSLRKDFESWADQFQSLYAQAIRAEQAGDPAARDLASRAMDQFRSSPRNKDIERAFSYGSAAPALGAEVAFLMAECVHERAERAQRDNPQQAAGPWRNAAEWWARYLDASARAGSPYPAREAVGKALLARSQSFAPAAK